MSYKYFTTRHGTDAPSKIIELRLEFPGCKYAGGVHKNSKGIWANKLLDREIESSLLSVEGFNKDAISDAKTLFKASNSYPLYGKSF